MLLTAGQEAIAQKPETKQETVIPNNKLDSALMESALRAENPDTNCGVKVAKEFKEVKIRMGGVRTLSAKDNPLVILDGIVVKMDTIGKLNPHIIESVTVLKSAEAIPIYGSEGVNGVFIITSKKPVKVKKIIPVKNSK
jgi:TonB-dependent SusC/RagA subfamily outer membrane receptor